MIDIKDLERRAKHDGMAALALAEARIMGIDCKLDPKAAYLAVQQSARLGNEHGRRAQVYMTASGTGRPADPDAALEMMRKLVTEDRFAAVQLAFLDHVTCARRLAEVQPKVISADPYIALFPALFSPAECRYLMTLAHPRLRAGTIYNASGEAVLDPLRDADATTLPLLGEDLVVQAINRCIASATNTQPGWGEPLTILRYKPGQQYHPHHDVYGPDKKARRQQTALVWLNDEFEGGATDFPNLKVTVRGGMGDMLVFRNITQDGEPDPRMLHAGMPVTSGAKWLASRWIRSEPYLK